MTSTNTLMILVTLVTALLASSSAPMANSRPLIAATTNSPSSAALAARLKKLEGSNCWESLLQLQACSGEIVMFFLNGETYLGQGCCQAIRVIGHECWPNVVGSLGFTTEETDMLEGYCDGEEPPPSPPLLLLPPIQPQEIEP